MQDQIHPSKSQFLDMDTANLLFIHLIFSNVYNLLFFTKPLQFFYFDFSLKCQQFYCELSPYAKKNESANYFQ